MQRSDWESRWDEGRIGFHQEQVTGMLAAHADAVWGSGGVGRMLVPLCGKSLDLVYLAERSDDVVGVEFASRAVVEFFTERGLDVDRDVEVVLEPLPRYRSGAHTIYAADFFDVTPAVAGRFDAAFDRAALVALDAPTRARYAEHLSDLLGSGATVLLVTFDYDQSVMDGPPFAVPVDEVHALFGDRFDIELLGTRDALDDDFAARGVTALSESALMLTRR